MSCVDLMYQFYSPYFPYKPTVDDAQKFGVSSMYEGVSPSATSTSLGDGGAGSGGGSGGPSPSDKMHREVEREGQPRATQYLASNCVLFTYFSGDPASVVDEHFSRALSQPSSYSLDKPGVQKTCTRPDTLLMCQRKLPASFWNSAYQPPPSATSSHGGFPLGAEAYFSPSLYGLHKSWPYTYSSQPHTYAHQSAHAFSYSGMDATRGLTSHYGSLVMPGAGLASRADGRSSQYELAKGGDAFSSAAAAGYYAMSRFGSDLGMETGLPGLDLPLQQTKKELYW
ncbi:transcription cofactor vestigial-like protein 2 [Pomacea canaliculata]|uniref:transcription cofactor vestigial-like protein 2 n=1 Tax=Pomacea canaliculata TaxID=400727 RepID=UPI000D72B645|nr:transcription cofactor vestigial-like protein 2 [Pomacea canaliculata]